MCQVVGGYKETKSSGHCHAAATGTHSVCDKRHKTCGRSNQTESLHGGFPLPSGHDLPGTQTDKVATPG